MMTDKPSKLPAVGTIAYAVLDRLRQAGDKGMHFNDLRHVYCQASPTWRAMNPGCRARQNFFERCGMTLVRILRNYAAKQGKSGGRGTWVYVGPVDAGFRPGDTVQVNRSDVPKFGTVRKVGGELIVEFNDRTGFGTLALLKRDCDLQPGGWQKNLVNLNRAPQQSPTLQVVLASLTGLTREERAQVAAACVKA